MVLFTQNDLKDITITDIKYVQETSAWEVTINHDIDNYRLRIFDFPSPDVIEEGVLNNEIIRLILTIENKAEERRIENSIPQPQPNIDIDSLIGKSLNQI